LRGGGDESFLDSVLGRSEVAKSSHHGTEHLRRQFSQQALVEDV
jgi:hypothetical protein